MTSPRLTPGRLTFLIAAPLVWAVLLMFHPAPAADDIYGSLRDEATRFLIVHVGTLVFIGLMGAALYLLVRDMPGTAARVSRLAILPFVLFYGAGEFFLGVLTGAFVRDANSAAPGERADLADKAQSLWDNFVTADLLVGIGAFAWVLAVVAAATAYRRAGAPTAVWVLLALSSTLAVHTPPTGPFGLGCFAAAVGLIAYRRRGAEAAGGRAVAAGA